MQGLLLALVMLALAACTPDEDHLPVVPGSGDVPPRLGMQSGSGGGGSTSPDAGTVGGLTDGRASDVLTITDGGLRGDARTFLDGRAPDATSLLPDAQSQIPPNP